MINIIVKRKKEYKQVRWDWALNKRDDWRSGWYGNAASYIPDKFIGSVIVSGSATTTDAYASADAEIYVTAGGYVIS